MDKLDGITNRCKSNLDEIWDKYESKQRRHWRNYWIANCIIAVSSLVGVVAGIVALYYANKVRNAGG